MSALMRKSPASTLVMPTQAFATATLPGAHPAVADQIKWRVRDESQALTQLAGPSPSLAILKGLRVTWHHLSTLCCPPWRPSEFDRFSGTPPIAARATKTFGPE